MTSGDMKAVLDKVLTWPPDKQEVALDFLRLLERQDAVYVPSDDELAAIRRGLAEAERGEFATDEEMAGSGGNLVPSVRFSSRARRDLEAIADYLLERNPSAALRFADVVRDTLVILSGHPYIWAQRPRARAAPEAG